MIRLFEAVHDNSYQKTVQLSKTRISLHAHEFSIIRMSLIWSYQRAPPDQRVTNEDSDLAIAWSIQADLSRNLSRTDFSWRRYIIQTDSTQ